ncbi:MAG: hypothetical protein IPJ13_14310 [Saprospiraceae bacterium]|nr:hypothetical protein [Saprospiraceae bacterium]
MSVAAGASEIDIVISRAPGIAIGLERFVRRNCRIQKACGHAHSDNNCHGRNATLTKVAKASMVAMMAGSDFIKTSTGKESVNATLPESLVMIRAIEVPCTYGIQSRLSTCRRHF